MGADVVSAFGLQGFAEEKNPVKLALEWGVRRLNEQLELRTRGGQVKRVVADFFPALDDDGGLLVALTPAQSGLDFRRRLARPAMGLAERTADRLMAPANKGATHADNPCHRSRRSAWRRVPSPARELRQPPLGRRVSVGDVRRQRERARSCSAALVGLFAHSSRACRSGCKPARRSASSARTRRSRRSRSRSTARHRPGILADRVRRTHSEASPPASSRSRGTPASCSRRGVYGTMGTWSRCADIFSSPRRGCSTRTSAGRSSSSPSTPTTARRAWSLNRPSPSRSRRPCRSSSRSSRTDEPVWVGGPVQPEAVLVLGEFLDPDDAAVPLFGALGFPSLDEPGGDRPGHDPPPRASPATRAGARASSRRRSRTRTGSSSPRSPTTRSPRIRRSCGATSCAARAGSTSSSRACPRIRRVNYESREGEDVGPAREREPLAVAGGDLVHLGELLSRSSACSQEHARRREMADERVRARLRELSTIVRPSSRNHGSFGSSSSRYGSWPA